MSELLPQHQRLLADSAIAPEVVAERGYWSATKPRELERLFGQAQRRLVPALVVPTYDVRGEVAFCQLRPDEPRTKGGRVSKYELPHGARMAVDVPRRVRPVLANPSLPLIITEGARKADAAVSAGLYAVDLVGVWTWRGRNGDGGLTALADFELIALKGRVVYLAFDSDAMQKSEVHQALERFAAFLRKRGAELRFVYLPSGDGGVKTGLDDFLAAGHTRDDVLALATDELRALPGEAAPNGKPHEPAPEVDGAALLADLRDFITRYVVLPSEEVADLLALWTLHTWAVEAAFATPYLRITSATADSGKTLLLEVLAALCRHAWHAVNPSTAVLYRKIDKQTPTLLLDEMDNYPMDERRDALAVLNAGYKRGATIDRCKDTGELEQFKAFCPKAYAGLDQRATVSTLLSRSITIRLERKSAAERVERWIAPLTEPDAEPLREGGAAWAHHNVDALHKASPDLPSWLVNRAAEVWWALLAIADEVGGDWPKRAREASRVLGAGGDQHDDAPDVVTLLADLRQAFGDDQTIFTENLLGKLNAIEEHDWGARRRGDGLDARGLASMLRPLKIGPKTVRVGSWTAKGYHVDQFADAFARHLPEASQASHPNAHGAGDVTDVTDVTDQSEAEHRARDDDPERATPEEDARAERLFREYEDLL